MSSEQDTIIGGELLGLDEEPQLSQFPVFSAEEEVEVSPAVEDYECNICDMGDYLAWFSTGTKFLYYVMNRVSIFECMHFFTWLTFIPSLILMKCEILQKLDFDCPFCENYVPIVSKFYYESWAAQMTQQIAMSPLYIFGGESRFFLSDGESDSESHSSRRRHHRRRGEMVWEPTIYIIEFSDSDSDSDSSSSSDSLSGFKDAGLQRIPFDFTWKCGKEILATLSWWTQLASIAIKQYCEPFLQFDEVTLVKIAMQNLLLDTWVGDIEYALGILALEAPWMALLWFLFDGNLNETVVEAEPLAAAV